MKAIYKITCILFISYAIFFCIAGGIENAHQFISDISMNVENKIPQDDNTPLNSFSLEDEDYQIDTIVAVFNKISIKFDFSIIILAINKYIPDSFHTVIWLPPKS